MAGGVTCGKTKCGEHAKGNERDEFFHESAGDIR
jgi:hypothetical protein